MYCAKCGKEIKEGARFCGNCRAPVGNSAAMPFQTAESKLAKAKSGKGKIATGIAAAVLAAAVGIGCVFYFTGDGYRLKKNMKMAEKHYEAGEYEEAIACYEAVFELDGVSEGIYEDVYLKMADAYLSGGDCLTAVQTLIDGAEDTGSDVLSEREEYVRENIVIAKETWYGGDNNIECWSEYEYDEQGNQIKAVSYDESGNIESRLKYEYDGQGNQTKRTSYDESGNIEGWSEHEYDGQGNQTKITYYAENGNIKSRSEYVYDTQGNKTKEVFYDENGNIKSWSEYEYDAQGDKTKSVDCDENGNIVNGYEHVYDAEGNEIKYVSYWDGKINSWSEYGYDGQGNQTKKVSYDESGNIESRSEYEYDGQRNQTKEVSYDENGNIRSWFEYEYDSQGNQTKMALYNPSGISWWEEYEYDTQGNMKGVSYDANGNITDWGEIEYDSEGNVIKKEAWHEDGSTERYEYAYDSEGNMVKEVRYPDGIIDTWTEYDAQGNITLWRTYDENGNIDSWDEYNAQGDPIKILTYDENGNIDSGFEYECDILGNYIKLVSYTDGNIDESYSYKYDYLYIGEYIDKENEFAGTLVNTADESYAAEAATWQEQASEETEETLSAEPEAQDASFESQAEEPVPMDINVETEVEQIREWFYDTQNNMKNYEQQTSDNAGFYYWDGVLIKITVKEGTDGWNYAREYYFHDNSLCFAFIFSGSEEHRLYFKEDQLIRYIDEDKIIYDYGDTEQFAEWKEPTIQEAYRLRETGMLQEKEVKSVEVSSILPEYGDKSYGGDKLIDGNVATPWIEGAEGKGEGEVIILHLSEKTDVHRILIYNGYLESRHLYEANGKPMKIQVDFGEGTIVTQSLDDWEYTEEAGVLPNADNIELSQPVMTDTITITIVEAQAGESYEDMCIGEIKVF